MLELRGIKKSFGKIEVLHGVDLTVNAGEVHALLGENGAGKSTLTKILCGILKPSEGEIWIDGEKRQFADYNEAINAGIGVVFQEFSLVPYLNAVENMFLARELSNGLGFMKRAAMRKRAGEIMRQLGITIPLGVPIRNLSVAEQQFVEIAKALALDARILVLDEPTATLTPTEVEHLFHVMRSLRAQGVSIIFISHHLEEIFEICDRITVLRDGEYVASCDVADVDQSRLVEMMVGRRIENSFPPKPVIPAEAKTVLDVEEVQLAKGGPVSSFKLRQGEILGFSGLVGSGRTETALAMLGAYPAARCKLRMNGVEIRFADPSEALAAGIGLLPESRKEQGLITSFPILQNVSLNNYGKYLLGHFFINRSRELSDTRAAMHSVRVKAPHPHVRVDTLSGGNQQKVVIARWINHNMKVLIFDEPTRGIDVGTKQQIYHFISALARDGHSVIVVSSEMQEVIGLCTRVAVMREGRMVGMLEGDEINEREIMRYAAGLKAQSAA